MVSMRPMNSSSGKAAKRTRALRPALRKDLDFHANAAEIDDGHQLVTGAHVLAGLRLHVGDAPGKWRAHAGAFQLELRLLHRDFGLLETALGACGFLPLGTHVRIGNALVEQRHLAVLRVRAAVARLCVPERQLVFGRIDGRERCARADDRVLLARHRLQLPRDLRRDHRLAQRRGLPRRGHGEDERVAQRDVAFDGNEEIRRAG
jgi:hypothetical protein